MLANERVALIGYASTHGSTKDIALRFQGVLEAAQYKVTVVDLCGLPFKYADVEAFVGLLRRASLVLLGSAMHYQDWLPETKRLLAMINGEILNLKCPVHFFTVCTVGSQSSFLGKRTSDYFRRIRPLPPQVLPFVNSQSGNRSHHFFAGRVQTAHWGIVGTIFVYCMGGSTGDHINWEEVDEWVRELSLP